MATITARRKRGLSDELKHFKAVLLEMRGTGGSVRQVLTSTLTAERRHGGNNADYALGLPTHEDMTVLGLNETVLDQIDSALERIEEGDFGICVECQGRIPKTRLKAIPHTPHCVKCAGKVTA